MTRRTSQLLVTAVGAVVVVALAVTLVLDRLDPASSGAATAADVTTVVVILLTLTVSLVVGAAVALTRRDNPVGWLFLVLGVVLVLEAPADEYVGYGAGAVGTLPGAASVAVVSGASWILWFTLVALVLLLTPTGRPLSPRWRAVTWLQAGAGVVAFLLALPSGKSLDPPYGDVDNPMLVDAVQPWADAVQTVCVYAIGLGLVASGVSLVVRFRRARGDDRRQLLWLVVAVAPLPLYVVVAFVSSYNGADLVTLLATGGFITLIPIAAGLSVLRYRLYDVERIVSTTVTWLLLTTVLVATYAFVVWFGARAVPTGPVSPVLSATVGAVAAAGLAFPLHRHLQDLVDRRFDRRAYDARRVIGAALGAEEAGVDVEMVLREALHEPGLTIAYPGVDGSWDEAPRPGRGARRRGPARPGRGPGLLRPRARPMPTTVRRAAALAAAELDNTRLRAELLRQVDEIAASRARLAGAQRTERRRIERDLHDGAQQRLLALAWSCSPPGSTVIRSGCGHALADGADSARTAVRELRALANGLHPAALEDGGLPAALDDMARLSTVPLRVSAPLGRLDPGPGVHRLDRDRRGRGERPEARRRPGHRGRRRATQRPPAAPRPRRRPRGRQPRRPGAPRAPGPGRDRARRAARGRPAPSGTTVEAVLPCES